MKIPMLHVLSLVRRAGVEVMFLDFLDQARRWQQYEHYVCALGLSESLKGELVSRGVSYFQPYRRGRYDLGAAVQIGKFIRDNEIRLVNCHNFTGNWWGTMGAWTSFRDPVLFTHEHGLAWYCRGLMKLLTRLSNARSENVVCNSRATQIVMSKHIRMRKKRLKVVYNGVSEDRLDCERRSKRIERQRLGISENHCVVLFVGRLEIVKAPFVLVKAATRILAECPECTFVVVGDGSLAHLLRAVAADDGIAGNVRFVGEQPDIGGWLAASDVLVLPSVREPLGNVLIEAGLARKPVVASYVDGIPEVVTHGKTGLLDQPEILLQTAINDLDLPRSTLPRFVVDPSSGDLVAPRVVPPEAIAESVLKLCRSREFSAEIGSGARGRCRQMFGIERYTSDLKGLFDRAVDHQT